MAQQLNFDALDIENNPYYKDSPENFLRLKNIVEKNPHCYFSLIKKDDIFKWITYSLPLLQDDFYKNSTRVYWILNSLTKFPICKTCGKEIKTNIRSISLGYQTYCSVYCENQSLKKEISMSKSSIKKRQFDSFLTSMPIIDQLKFLVKKYEDSYPLMIKSRKWLNDYVNNNTPLLNDSFFKMSTKLYWIFNNITSWDDLLVKCKTCKKPFLNYNIGSINSGYPTFCSQSCVMQDSDVLNQISCTCMQNYGVKSPAQNHEIQKKTKTIYQYEKINFRSSWELAFYIYHKDKNDNIEYSPKIVFEYQDQYGKVRKYFPDFLLNGKLYEIKGEQFFDKDGLMCNPFNHNLDRSFELKRQCVIKNNVIFIRKDDISPIINYISQKYGKDYLQKFRKKKVQQDNI